MLLKIEMSDIILFWDKGWPVIALIAGFLVIFELSRIPARIKAKKAYSHLSGRAMGTVINSYKEQILLSSYHYSSDERDHYEYKTIVMYQYEVDGQVHTGQGEGSGALWHRKHQMICYDPSDPGDSCTLFYAKRETKSHALKTLIVFIVVLAVILWIALYLGQYRIG